MRDLEALIKGRWCLRCEQRPTIVWQGNGALHLGRGMETLRCGCYPLPPKLVREPDQAHGVRMGGMMSNRLDDVHGRTPEGVPEGALVDPDTGELVPLEPPQPAIEVFKGDLALVRAVVAEMMPQIHYGIIPGTRDKSLWEPGAEYLRRAFRIRWDFEVVYSHEEFDTGDFRYTVRAVALDHAQDPGAKWEASAWSKERKFWCSRDCARDCDKAHPPKQEKEVLWNNVKDRAIKRAFVNLIRNVTGTSGEFKEAQT